MIIADFFAGDSSFMQQCQHEVYLRSVCTIFHKAKMTYLHALKVVNVDTKLGRDILEKRSIDHRVVQDFHDIIAARFRYLNKQRLNQHHLPGVLFEQSEGAHYTALWLEYYEKTLEWLYETTPRLVWLVLTACAYPNPDTRGSEAEDQLMHQIDWLKDWGNLTPQPWEYAYSELQPE